MTTPRTQSTTRETKALDLIQAGAVALVPGQKFAIVRGSGKLTYRVSRDGCTCPDWAQRGEQVGPCKHMLAVHWLCDVAKMAQHQARRHGRTRLPAALGRALAAGQARERRVAQVADELFGAVA